MSSNEKPSQTAMPWGRELNVDDLPQEDRQAGRILLRMLEVRPPNPVEYLKQHQFKILRTWEELKIAPREASKLRLELCGLAARLEEIADKSYSDELSAAIGQLESVISNLTKEPK